MAPWPSLSTKALLPYWSCNLMGSSFQWVNRPCPLVSPTSAAQISCVRNIWSHSGEKEFWSHQDPGDQSPTPHKHINRCLEQPSEPNLWKCYWLRPKQKHLSDPNKLWKSHRTWTAYHNNVVYLPAQESVFWNIPLEAKTGNVYNFFYIILGLKACFSNKLMVAICGYDECLHHNQDVWVF